jgi:cysteine dioxygenase
MPTTQLTLHNLFAELDRCETSVPIDMLVDRMQRLDLSSAGLDAHVRFADHGYCRNLIHLGPGYAALVLCWRAGQMSPIHDHRGSACALRVLRGTATELRYGLAADGSLVEAGTYVYAEGSVCGTYDSDIHSVVNRQPQGHDLVTLHVYTPPMRAYYSYAADGTRTLREDGEVLAEERRRAEARKAPGGRPLTPAGTRG